MLPCLTQTAPLAHADSGAVNKAVECFTGPACHQRFCSFKSKSFSVFGGLFWSQLEFSVFSFWTVTTCEHVFVTWGWSVRYHGMGIYKAWHPISTRLYLTHKHTQTHIHNVSAHIFSFSSSVNFLVCLFIRAPIHKFCVNDITPCSQCSVEHIWVIAKWILMMWFNDLLSGCCI